MSIKKILIFLVVAACFLEKAISYPTGGYNYGSSNGQISNETILSNTVISCIQDQISNYSVYAYSAGATFSPGATYGNSYGNGNNYGNNGNSYGYGNPLIFSAFVSFPYGYTYGDAQNTTMFFNAVVACIQNAINSTGLDGYVSGVSQPYTASYSTSGYGNTNGYGNGGYGGNNYGPVTYAFSAIFPYGIDNMYSGSDSSYSPPNYPGLVPIYAPVSPPTQVAYPTASSYPTTATYPSAPTYPTAPSYPQAPAYPAASTSPSYPAASSSSSYPTASTSSPSYQTSTYSTSSSEAAGY